jgi:hypothetical protein
MKKLPKSIETRISEINAMIPQVNELGDYAWTYDGGTWPYMVDIEPIETKGLKVIIRAKNQKDQRSNYITKDTFNAKKTDLFDENGLVHLKHSLSVILKAFKQALK